MSKILPYIILCASIVASIGGMVLFIVLFIPDFNIYWLILSPIILVLYQAPAAFLFRLYKRTKRNLKKLTPDMAQED